MEKDGNSPLLANEVEGGFNTTNVTDSLESSSQSIESTKVASEQINGDLLHLLKLVLKKVDALENHAIKLDVKIDQLRRNFPPKTDNVPQLNVIDIDELAEFGLPVDTEAGLKKLERRLKNDKDFKKKLVSIYTIIFIEDCTI